MSELYNWMPTKDVFEQCDRVQVSKQLTGRFNMTFHLLWYKEKTDIKCHKAISYDGFDLDRNNDTLKEIRNYFVDEKTWKLTDNTRENVRIYSKVTINV